MKKIIEKYVKHLHGEKDIIPIALKGHLLLESLIDQIIGTILPNPQYIKNQNFTFYKKVLLARAMSWDKHKIKMWDLIIAVNSLRNELVHYLESKKLDNKIKTVVQKFKETDPQHPLLKNYKSKKFEDQLKTMILYLAGFLDSYLSDAKAYRKIVDSLYATLKAKK